MDGVHQEPSLSDLQDRGGRGPALASSPPSMREQQLPASLDRPAGENRRAEVLAACRVDAGWVIRVVQAERSGDPIYPVLVHLLQRQDVGSSKAVLLEHLDSAVDLAGELDVEGD
jgi:hypothetical protein